MLPGRFAVDRVGNELARQHVLRLLLLLLLLLVPVVLSVLVVLVVPVVLVVLVLVLLHHCSMHCAPITEKVS